MYMYFNACKNRMGSLKRWGYYNYASSGDLKISKNFLPHWCPHRLSYTASHCYCTFIPPTKRAKFKIKNLVTALSQGCDNLVTTAQYVHTSSLAAEEGGGWSADPTRALVRVEAAAVLVEDGEVSTPLEERLPLPNECWNWPPFLLRQLVWWAINVWITFFRCH